MCAMSNVRAACRSKSGMDLHTKANVLAKHTIHIAANPSVFDPMYASFTAEVVKTCVDAGRLLWMANGIHVGDRPDRWERRRELQERACEEYDSLLYLIEIAHGLYSLRKGKYEYWARKAREVRDLARKWRDSDARRYGHLTSGSTG